MGMSHTSPRSVIAMKKNRTNLPYEQYQPTNAAVPLDLSDRDAEPVAEMKSTVNVSDSQPTMQTG